ncbi:hypothetical protein B7Y92_00445 [Candidatus Saccharibacteria bacterium 32-50-13]|nr:MAG: hypothetical protein B7Y92_00445 [Candidatus Saccharibacteria bacterium 32-50-13]
MPNKITVSVVVPVYDSEEFLPKCLDSILDQRYEDIEVILVNDGSTDGSGEICNSYCRQDGRIRVYHQENRGVSVARNVGIDNALGQYVAFVDSDDIIHQDYIQNLLDDVLSYNMQIATTGTINFITEVPSAALPSRKASTVALSRNEAILDLYRGTLEGTRNGMQIFSLSLLNDNGVRYDEAMAVGEDFDFFARAILCSSGVVVDKREMYFYRFNPSSAMLQRFNKNHFEAIANVEKVGRSVQDQIPGLCKAIDSMVFSDAVYYGAKAVSVRRKWAGEYDHILRLIRKYRKSTLFDPRAKRNTRVKALLMVLFGVKNGLLITRRLIRW